MSIRRPLPASSRVNAMTDRGAADGICLTLRRESIWYVGGRASPDADCRGHYVTTLWSVFVEPGTLGAIESAAVPLVRALSRAKGARVVVTRESGATFAAGALREGIDRVSGVDALLMVELAGAWSTPALEVLAMIRPVFVRLSSDFTAGAGVLPEQSRRLTQLVDVMGRAGVPVVAQGPLLPEDDSAARAAGIDLRIMAESGSGLPPWNSREPLGAACAPVVLDFPRRPPVE